MIMPSIKFGSGRGSVRSIVIGLLVWLAVKRGDRDLAKRLATRLSTPFDDARYRSFANSEWNRHRVDPFATVTRTNLARQDDMIVFQFDDEIFTDVILADRFCKHFNIDVVPAPVLKYRSAWWRRLRWSLKTRFYKYWGWALIPNDVREQCETTGCSVVQMALAAPHNIMTPPYGWQLFFVVPQQIAVRAWVVEQDRKQRRHERLSFIVELAILLFVFVEMCISIYDLFDKVARH
jgi:hypothetical protein